MEKIKVFEAFAGYGSQSIALKNIGIPHKVVAISEIDADAIISYGAIRNLLDYDELPSPDEMKKYLMYRGIGYDYKKGKSAIPRMSKDKLNKLYTVCVKTNNLGDISKVNPNDVPNCDLFTYSFPCTDLSIAGLQKGFDKGSGTSSSLLWECEKIIEVKRPKYLLMENVKMLVSQKYKPQFDKWCEILENIGYKNYYKVLNAKNYGIPQNRERVFMISIHDDTQGFEFPDPIPLTLCLKDLLCDNIDEKYFIDSKHSPRLMKALEEKKLNYDKLTNSGEDKLIAKTIGSRDYDGFKSICPCLRARDWKDPKTVLEKKDELKLYDNLEGGKYDHEYDYKRRVYETDGISPPHVASNTPKIIDENCP